MDLQEITLYDLDLGVKVTQNVAQYNPHHVTYAPGTLKFVCQMVQEKMHLQENTLVDLDLKVKVT